MRVLTISNMYPSPAAPGYGVFVANHVHRMQKLPGVEVVLVASSVKSTERFDKVLKYLDLWVRSALVSPAHFDLIHLHYPMPLHLLAAVIPWLRSHRKPLVLTSHGGDITRPPPSGASRAFVSSVFRKADAVIAVSGSVATSVRDLGTPVERIHTIHMGCDLSVFSPAPDRARAKIELETPNVPTLLFVGDLIHRKGLDVLIEALLKMPDPPRLVVAGAGPQRESIERRIRGTNVESLVRWLGSVPQRTLSRWFAAADVFVFPTRDEPFGLVTIEAMASGTPVIASGVGGILEIIRHTRNGILVPPENSDALSSAISDMLSDSDKRRRVAEQALVDVAEHSLDRQVGRVMDVYQKVLGPAS